MPFEIGQAIGDYEILDVLDATVGGVTYKVRNQLAGRLEALKILPADLRQDRERVERFLREIKILARLDHPNIASFYTAMEIDGELAMTSELIPGMTLEQRLQQSSISLKQAVDYTLQVLAGLCHAHSQGVVHRNIAPSSIMVTPKGNVKIGEFGYAKALSDPRLTLTGAVLGPMCYLAPEQVKGIPDLDARTDLYALGMVLYELVTGKRAFDSKNQFDVMEAQVRSLPEPPSSVRSDLPKALDAVIFTAVAKDPAERYQSASDFGAALERVSLAADSAESPDHPQPASAPEETVTASLPLDRLNEDEALADPPNPSQQHAKNEEAPPAGNGRRPASLSGQSKASHPASRTVRRHPQRQAKILPRVDPFLVGGISFVATTLLLIVVYVFTQ